MKKKKRERKREKKIRERRGGGAVGKRGVVGWLIVKKGVFQKEDARSAQCVMTDEFSTQLSYRACVTLALSFHFKALAKSVRKHNAF